MHNCKTTKEQLIEAARGPAMPSSPLLEELERCPACRGELASLRSLFRVTDLAFESTSPPENFWPGHHARLKQSLERETSPAFLPPVENATLALLRSLFTTSIRVPIPLAAVLVVFFGLSIAFAMESRRRPATAVLSGTSTVVTKTLEVPVIRDRTVTRVVYRDRGPRMDSSGFRPPQLARNRIKIAGGSDEPTANSPISLVGFKPTSDPKLTIIKGSYRDEK
jgi:hypothetical protein